MESRLLELYLCRGPWCLFSDQAPNSCTVLPTRTAVPVHCAVLKDLIAFKVDGGEALLESDAGITVAAGKFTADAHADLVAGTALGGKQVRVFDGQSCDPLPLSFPLLSALPRRSPRVPPTRSAASSYKLTMRLHPTSTCTHSTEWWSF